MGADLHMGGPADDAATPLHSCLLLQLNADWFYLSGTGSPGCPGGVECKYVVDC